MCLKSKKVGLKISRNNLEIFLINVFKIEKSLLNFQKMIFKDFMLIALSAFRLCFTFSICKKMCGSMYCL